MVGTCCMSLLFLGSTALALTPDGETPAVEQYCNDNFTGKARGLCNAYCEATDCHFQFDDDNLTDPKASDEACVALQGKFLTAAQDAGVSIPDTSLALCEQVNPADCPCRITWTNNNGAGDIEGVTGPGELSGDDQLVGCQKTIVESGQIPIVLDYFIVGVSPQSAQCVEITTPVGDRGSEVKDVDAPDGFEAAKASCIAYLQTQSCAFP